MGIRLQIAHFFMACRKQSGKSLEDVSQATHLQVSEIEKLENGSLFMPIEIMEKLVVVYGVQDETVLEFSRKINSDIIR